MKIRYPAPTARSARTGSDSAFPPLAPLRLGMLILILLPGAHPQSLPGETVREAGRLALHQPIERGLGLGQGDVFTVDVAAGLFLHVVVEHDRVNVVLSLENPEGQTLVTAINAS